MSEREDGEAGEWYHADGVTGRPVIIRLDAVAAVEARHDGDKHCNVSMVGGQVIGLAVPYDTFVAKLMA